MVFCRLDGGSQLAPGAKADAELLKSLNAQVHHFAGLAHKHKCELVEFAVDELLVISGHDAESHDHAEDAIRLALDMLSTAKSANSSELGLETGLNVSIGLHTGKVCAGVLGSQRIRYAFFGEAVSGARRLASRLHPMNIRVRSTSLQPGCLI